MNNIVREFTVQNKMVQNNIVQTKIVQRIGKTVRAKTAVRSRRSLAAARADAVTLWCCATVLAGMLGSAPVARAQGSRKDDIVFNAQGRPMAGASIRVCTASATGQPCMPLANIYSDAALTQALANPTTTDGLGNYSFYAAPGRYMIEINGPGITTKQLSNVILPNDPSAPTFTSLTTTSGINAFSLSLSGNLTVTGSTAVTGGLTVGGAAVPSTAQANTWSAAQTFNQDLISGSRNPWTDVRANGSVCDGVTDATSGVVSTLTGLSSSGGTAFLPDNCKITPPTTLPTASQFMRIGLGGQLALTSTLHLTGPYQVDCQNPGLHVPASSGVASSFEMQCPIIPTTAFGFTPLVSEEANAFVVKNLNLNQFCGAGLLIFPTGNGDAGIVDNVFSQAGNCNGNSSGVEQNYGFGVWYKGGGFTSSRIGTQASIWMHALPGGDPPGSITTFDHTFMHSHGIRYDTSGSVCTASGQTSNIRSIQQLYESANELGHNPPDPNSPFLTLDTANCSYNRILLDSPEMDDATGTIPYVAVVNSAGTNPMGYRMSGLFLLNPNAGSTPLITVDAHSLALNSTIFSPDGGEIGLYGTNCSYFSYIAGSQVNCNSITNVPVADIAGHAIGMASPNINIGCTASTTGGSLATGTYYVLPVAEGKNVGGTAAETVPGNEYVVPVTGPAGSITCAVGGTIFPNGATGIRFYYGTAGSLQESVYERSNPTMGNYGTFTIIGSGAVSATPAQLQPNPATMAVTDALGGQYETVATADTPVYGPTACFGIGMRCGTLTTYRAQIAGKTALTIGGFDGIFTHANTANRTYTLPDATGTVALTSNLPLSANATLTYTAIAAQTCQEQTVTVAGAATTGVASASPAASVGNANLSWSAWVSAANTVSVRVCNVTAGSVTPSAVSWQVRVLP